MRERIIQTLLRYPFRFTAESIAEQVLENSAPTMHDCFIVWEELLLMAREGILKRSTQNKQGVFSINLQRPSAHVPIKLLNMLIVCAAGAPLYTIVDAAAFGETDVADLTLKVWQNVPCHPVKRIVILTTHSFTDIFPHDAWYPWGAELLDPITQNLLKYSVTVQYFLGEPDGQWKDS